MHLVLVTETFVPEVNGVAMTLDRWTRGMAACGHRVCVVRPRQKATSTPVPGREEREVRGAALPGYAGLQFGFPCGGKLQRWWRQDRPDVVHVATEGPLGWSAIRAASKLGIPVVSSFHTNFHQYGKHYRIGFLKSAGYAYMRWLHNQTRATFVPTWAMRDELRRDGFRGVRVLSRGVDTQLYDPQRRSEVLRRQWGVGEGELVAAYVGRIAAEKNIGLAIEAYQAMRKVRPDARMVLVGDGPARAGLEKEHPQFIFAGMQRGEKLAEHYASADVLLFPSVTETFGNVITEGMASGLTVVAYDYAAAREHIRDGENGFAARFDDRESFLQKAVEAAKDVSRMQALGQAARRSVERQTWERVVEKYEKMLGKVIAKK